MNNDKTPDTSSPEYLERRKDHEEFQAQVSKMWADTGIMEVKNHDEHNDSPEPDTYTISFGYGMKKQPSEPKD